MPPLYQTFIFKCLFYKTTEELNSEDLLGSEVRQCWGLNLLIMGHLGFKSWALTLSSLLVFLYYIKNNN